MFVQAVSSPTTTRIKSVWLCSYYWPYTLPIVVNTYLAFSSKLQRKWTNHGDQKQKLTFCSAMGGWRSNLPPKGFPSPRARGRLSRSKPFHGISVCLLQQHYSTIGFITLPFTAALNRKSPLLYYAPIPIGQWGFLHALTYDTKTLSSMHRNQP